MHITCLAGFPKCPLTIHISHITDNTCLNKYVNVLNIFSKMVLENGFQLPVNYVTWDLYSTFQILVPEFLLK